MPTSSSFWLKRFLFYSGCLPAVETIFWTKNQGHAAKIVGYHRILENGFFHRSALSHETLARRFEHQIRYFRKHYRILPLTEIVEKTRQGASLPNRCLSITFDDGYRDLLTVGGPILEKYEVEATCFLATHFTETNELFPFDSIAYAIQNTRVRSFRLAPDDPLEFHLETPEGRKRAMVAADTHFKKLSPEREKAFLGDLCTRLEVHVPETYSLENGLLNWQEVKDLSRSRLQFEAHSVNHSTLTGKTQEQIRREVTESKTEIERQTGRPVTLFCYPSGKKEDFQEKAKAVIKEAGYLGAVTGLRGTFSVSDDLFEMRRYILDPDLRIEELVSRTSTALPRRL